MSASGDRLKEFRDYLGFSYAKMAEFYGIPASNWEYNEKRAKALAPEILEALLGKQPPVGKGIPRKAWLLAVDDGPMIEVKGGIRAQEGDDAGARPDVTLMLPEHVQEAYKIVREALDVAKADISTMDQDQVGLVIGLAAEEIARGNRVEARQTLLRRAEVLLGLKPQ